MKKLSQRKNITSSASALLFLALIVLAGCNGKPKVISSLPESQGENTIVSQDSDLSIKQVHQVTVEQVLETERYDYLYVDEGGEKFWIAVTKREVAPGDSYYFRDGLLKKNFYSQEYDRVFETLYLVSDIWSADGKDQTVPSENDVAATAFDASDVKPAAGAVKIADLVGNMEKYRDKKVKVTGKCVKVNPNIMNRNWVHLKDASSADRDIVVTTQEVIPLGAVVTVEGTVALDKDFGAGYRYDIIVEGAQVK